MTDLDVSDLLDRATLAADALTRRPSRPRALPGGVSSLTYAARMDDRRPAAGWWSRSRRRGWRRYATATCCARRGC